MKWGVLVLLLAAPAHAGDAAIVLLGEAHDNPGHHVAQAREVARIAPAALVFEMLTSDQAARVGAENRQAPEDLAVALDWSASGWPDFAMYYPIFEAAPNARIYGAGVPRAAARAALTDGIAANFGAESARFGLTTPLPEPEQAAREEDQRIAHCDALPATMLTGMVDLQRLRDAVLARAALQALDDTGGAVVVITGNGHARRDGGVPAVLALARPGVTVRAVGQAEAGQIDGMFDEVWPGDPVDRPDPCAGLRATTGQKPGQ